ncbi:DUF4400 domain-containing protein [Pseudoduganella lutea]|uniref:DUF4400 domain-containing protein n=1 Tax=Pseudoduganella lutea TaxID=321985 RepID=A0A4P6L3P3_9BURK|nr:DUF4400 domain-containing protein [Pseudoduganella lutea]QBE66276.1 DUF4400 domain-containing protein [Pseudoduganella lutea]
MIRCVAIASLVTLLMLVLYLPAVTPPAAFFERVRSEYSAHGATWGQGLAYRALEDAMAMLERPVSAPLMNEGSAQQAKVATAAGQQFDTVSRRLLDSDYLRAFNALALLAGFRLAVLAQLAPGLFLLATAYVVDGLARRWVKGREFSQHHPEVWTGSVCCVCIACCAGVISSVLPVAVPLALLPSLTGCVFFAAGFAIANYPLGQARH